MPLDDLDDYGGGLRLGNADRLIAGCGRDRRSGTGVVAEQVAGLTVEGVAERGRVEKRRDAAVHVNIAPPQPARLAAPQSA